MTSVKYYERNQRKNQRDAAQIVSNNLLENGMRRSYTTLTEMAMVLVLGPWEPVQSSEDEHVPDDRFTSSTFVAICGSVAIGSGSDTLISGTKSWSN